MLPDRVSNPGPLTYESGALPIALRGPAALAQLFQSTCSIDIFLFKIFACGQHVEQPWYLPETDFIYFALHFWSS